MTFVRKIDPQFRPPFVVRSSDRYWKIVVAAGLRPNPRQHEVLLFKIVLRLWRHFRMEFRSLRQEPQRAEIPRRLVRVKRRLLTKNVLIDSRLNGYVGRFFLSVIVPNRHSWWVESTHLVFTT